MVLPQGIPSATKALASSLHSHISRDDLFWSYRSDHLRNVAGKRDTYFEFRENQDRRGREIDRNRSEGPGLYPDQDWVWIAKKKKVSNGEIP